MLKKLLILIGATLERVGRALRWKAGHEDFDTPSAESISKPKGWLDLLAKSQVPLVWIRRKADDISQPPTQPVWQRGAHWNEAQQPALTQGTAAFHLPSFADMAPLVGFERLPSFLELPEGTSSPNIKWPQPWRMSPVNPQSEAVTHESSAKPLRLLFPPPSPHQVQSKTAAKNKHTKENLFRLVAPEKISHHIEDLPARQADASLKRSIPSEVENLTPPRLPQVPAKMSANPPRYETHLTHLTQEAPLWTPPSRTSASAELFPQVASSSADHWPSLLPDWLTLEPEGSFSSLEEDYKQRLRREQRGE